MYTYKNNLALTFRRIAQFPYTRAAEESDKIKYEKATLIRGNTNIYVNEAWDIYVP